MSIISCSFRFSLKRLHLQHNQIRTIPFLKVLQGRQIVQEFSKTALKRKQASSRKCMKAGSLSRLALLYPIENSSANYFQHGFGGSNDVLIKSTIFEEDEENGNGTPNPNTVAEDEDVSLPAFPELQYLDLSHNLVIAERTRSMGRCH